MSNALISIAQQFSGLNMDALIGGPLNASARANAAMALTQTKFMLNTCFTKTTPAGSPNAPASYEPIMINMTLTRGVITPPQPQGSPLGSSPPTTTAVGSVSTNFNLPLLTIIPLNSLAVTDIEIYFEMNVSSSSSEDQSKASETKIAAAVDWEVKAGWGPVSVSVKGHASYDRTDSSNFSSHYEKKNSAKYVVTVKAGQLPLPKGVNTIIEAYAKAIEPITVGTTSP